MRTRHRAGFRLSLALVVTAAVAACSSSEPMSFDTRATTTPPGAGGTAASAPASTAAAPVEADIEVTIDRRALGAEISPYITGISGSIAVEAMEAAGITATSFGGNPSTRYNYDVGHAWNQGADWEFRNTNYGNGGDVARSQLELTASIDARSRLAIPTLGWIAKNDDPDTCSFPDGTGGCLSAADVGDCRGDGPVADPERANVRSTPEQVTSWVRGLVADGLEPDVIAMDNEPELWGLTHYDVHPECPTYEEILDKYLTYATAMRSVAPNAQLAGPVACCWYDYWKIAPGPADGPDEDYLTWFLRSVKAHDDATGVRTIDMLDVHFYPQSDVYNDETDEATNARRLRSTRALWDPYYDDESWIDARIEFLPRMKATIERTYPGLPILVSEWSFGADGTVNGALAMAEALAIFGREGVAMANYWFQPAVDSPGYLAFKMHGNYDGQGSRFGGTSVATTSSDSASVSAFGAVDDGGTLRVMLINKDPHEAHAVAFPGLGAGPARTFTFGDSTGGTIVAGDADLAAPLDVAPYSITVVEIAPS